MVFSPPVLPFFSSGAPVPGVVLSWLVPGGDWVMFPAPKPDLLFGEFRVAWGRASQRVLVVGRERCVRCILPDFVEVLEEYACESELLLFIPGEREPFRGNTDKLGLLEKLVVAKGGRVDVPDEELFAVYRDLFGSVVLLVGPAAFSEASPQTREVLGVGALYAARIVWRHARLLSFAALAVIPESGGFFRLLPELRDACMRIPLRAVVAEPAPGKRAPGEGGG